MEYERLLETPTSVNTSPDDTAYIQVIDPDQTGGTQSTHNRSVVSACIKVINSPSHRSESAWHSIHTTFWNRRTLTQKWPLLL